MGKYFTTSKYGPATNGGPISTYLTECGYNTMTGGIGCSELAQMKWTTQLFATGFATSTKVYLHQLMDESATPSDENGNWGILRFDGSRKPAFVAVKNMISLLSEAVWNTSSKSWSAPNFNPGALDYSLPATQIGDGRKIEQLLSQKSNGDFYLLVWLDADNWDQATKTDLNPSRTETMTFTQPQNVTEYRYNANGDLVDTALAQGITSVPITIPGSVLNGVKIGRI